MKDQILTFVEKAEKKDLAEGEAHEDYDIEAAYAESEVNAHEIVEISTPVHTLSEVKNSLSLVQFINWMFLLTRRKRKLWSTLLKIREVLLNVSSVSDITFDWANSCCFQDNHL